MSFNGKYGRILDEVAVSSNNKYFAPIYEYLASRQEEGIIEVEYLPWKRKILGEEGGEELKGYKKFAQFNKAILKKVLDEMKSLGEEGIDCWVEKVEKVYLHGERADNPDKLRFHMYITKLGKELYEDKKIAYNSLLGIVRSIRADCDAAEKARPVPSDVQAAAEKAALSYDMGTEGVAYQDGYIDGMLAERERMMK